MSEITGNLLVYVHCRVKPSTENLAFIAQVFAKTAADLGITCGSAQIDSAGKTAASGPAA